MKKIINFFKKNDNLTVIIILMLSIIGLVVKNNFYITGDPMWAFSNIYKMSIGYKIYEQVNVIVTPLFFKIGNILFLLLGKNYLVFKSYNLIIITSMIYIVYQILKAIGKNKKTSILGAISILFIIPEMISQEANYNTLAVTFCLLGILLIIKENEKKINKVLQGITIFLIFLSKQNMVIFYLIGLVTYKIITTKSLKKAIKELIIPALVSLGLLLIFIMYMNITKNLKAFLNYTFLGINEFGYKNFRLDLYIAIFVIVEAIYIILLFNKKICKIKPKLKEILILFLSFGTPLILTIFPICNKYHFYMGMIILLIGLIAVTNEMILNEILNEKEKSVIVGVFLIAIISFSLYKSIIYFKFINNKDYNLKYSNPLFRK